MDLVIDGNAMLNVVTNAVMYGIRKDSNFDTSYIVDDEKLVLKESSRQVFRNSFLKYLNGVIFPIRGTLNHVYFVFDSVSWRKFYVEKYCLRHDGVLDFAYKGNRKEDEHKRELIAFFDFCREDVMPELQNVNGIFSIKVKGAEGDDVIAVLNERLNDNVIIWTVDSDMSQLVRKEPGFRMILGKRSKNKLRRMVLPHGHDDKSGLLEFSMGTNEMSQISRHLLSDKEYEAMVVEPNEFTLRKIICGDLKSDNIPSIYMKITPSGLRLSITDKIADKIIDIIAKKHDVLQWIRLIDSKDQEFMSDVVDATCAVLKLTGEQREIVMDNLELNYRLIRLSTAMLPVELVNMIDYKLSELDNNKFDYHAFIEYVKTTEP